MAESSVSDPGRRAHTLAEGTSAPDHLVILVHGINTWAHWMGEIKPTLEHAGLAVAATSYDKFGIPRFLAPFPQLRRKAIERVVSNIGTAIRRHRRETGAYPKQ